MVNPYKTVEQEQVIYTRVMEITDDSKYKEILEDYDNSADIMYNLKNILYDILGKARIKNDKEVLCESEQMLKELTKLDITMK